MVTFERPSTWRPYRSSLCSTCWANCCRLPVEVSAEDLRRMGIASEDEVTGSLKKLARRLKQEKLIVSFRARSGVFTLSQRPDGDCVYLDPKSRKCSIYDRRPSVCRDFPSVGPRPGYCPEKARIH